MHELRDKIELAIKTLKNQNQSEDALVIISLLEDTFSMILDRNRDLEEAINKLDMLSVDLVRRDTHRSAMLKIEELEQEIVILKTN
jgi:hypothetical protein